MVQTLEALSKAVLKRGQLEEWIDVKFDLLSQAVIGAFVRCNHKQKDRLALVIDAKDEDDCPVYSLGKKKTKI